MEIGGLTVSWLAVGIIAPLMVVLLVVFVRAPRNAASAGRRFARQHLAYVDAEFVAAFDRETVRRQRIGIVVLLPTVVWYVLAMLDHETSTLAVTLVPGVLALAASTEGLWRVVRAGREFAVGPGRPGFARGRQPVVRDYVGNLTVVRLVLQGLLGATQVGGAIAWAGADGWSPPAAGLLASGIVVLALSLAAPLAWAVVVRRPQRAVDPAHLYFQDAWRAEALRNTGPLPMVVPIAAQAAWPQDSAAVGSLVVVLLLLAFATIGTGLVDELRRLHFRARLWPTLRPGQVLLSGEPG